MLCTAARAYSPGCSDTTTQPGRDSTGYPRRVAEIRDATVADLDGIHELLTARNVAAFGRSELTRRQLEVELRQLPADRFVAEEGDRVVGYAELGATRDVQVAAAERGVGDALLEHVERRARERGFTAVAATVVEEDRPFHALVRRAGFSHGRDVLRMWRFLNGDLPQPGRPAGVTVREYREEDGAAIHALLDTAYAAWDAGYVPMRHEDWLAFMTGHDEFDPDMWFVAERDGDIVGCALHWKEHDGRGWVKDLAVRDDARGSGLGHALLRHGLRAYAARGADRVGLKVDSTNPTGAIRLYERVGFRVDRRYGMWTKAL